MMNTEKDGEVEDENYMEDENDNTVDGFFYKKKPVDHTPVDPTVTFEQYLRKFRDMPDSILSIDVGQTYLASTVISKRPMDVMTAKMRGKLSSKSDGEKVDEKEVEKTIDEWMPRYEISYMGIDEFHKGSAPHQPVYTVDNPGQMKIHREIFETLDAQLQLQSKTKRKATEKKKKASEDHATTNMNEIEVCLAAVDRILAFIRTYGVSWVLVEDQLVSVRRNRMVQLSIMSACRACDVAVTAVPPNLKFTFGQVEMQKMYNKYYGSKISKSLKDTSVRMYEEIVAMTLDKTRDETQVNPQKWMDFWMFDLKESLTHEFHQESYVNLNPWYRKDVTDSFWQAIYALKIQK